MSRLVSQLSCLGLLWGLSGCAFETAPPPDGDEQTVPGQPDPGDSNCGLLFGPCGHDFDCCADLFCHWSHVCVPYDECGVIGQWCMESVDCCDGACIDNVCTDLTPYLWVETWQAASPGDKNGGFNADNPEWGVQLWGNQDGCGAGARVWIDDEQRLCLRASAESPAEINICALGTSASALVSSGVFTIGDPFAEDTCIRLTRDTVFSGIFECDVEFDSAFGYATASIGIACGGETGGFAMTYEHRDSVYRNPDGSTDHGDELIIVANYFERNVFDDFTAVFCDESNPDHDFWEEYADLYLEGPADPAFVFIHIACDVSVNGAAPASAECTMRVHRLELRER